MNRLIILLSTLLIGAAAANAVPAKPGIHSLRQPDGSYVEATIIGDEHFHYYETVNGELLMKDSTGKLRPVSVSAEGEIVVSGEITGKATSPNVRANFMKAVGKKRAEMAELNDAVPSRIAPAAIKTTFPTTGTVTGLILLCEFQDVKFTEGATKEHYETICNAPGYSSAATHGSVLDYFTAQSNGQFTPKFDVFGPITLPYDCAHYGMTNDVNNLFRDAALEADKMGLDFSKYDINEDYFVDFLFVVFAGHGEAQGGGYDTIWPAMQDLSNYVYDYFDGLNLGVAACSCELKGATGTELDGVGTICHEFSHILGLADIYDTSQSGGHGMSHYDIMDIGTYNDNQVTPSGYTAMDKWTLGWLTPTVLETARKDVRLEPFDSTHQACFIVNPNNPNEYYTLENRQQQGWDKGIPGHGLVLSYCHYEPKLWRRNVINSAQSAGYEHVVIMAADNIWGTTVPDEAGDPYPGTTGNTSFSAVTTPHGYWYSDWPNGKNCDLNFEITNIRESEDGVITFDFNPDATGVNNIAAAPGENIYTVGNSIVAPENARIYDISGRPSGRDSLAPGIYVVKSADTTVKLLIK